MEEPRLLSPALSHTRSHWQRNKNTNRRGRISRELLLLYVCWLCSLSPLALCKCSGLSFSKLCLQLCHHVKRKVLVIISSSYVKCVCYKTHIVVCFLCLFWSVMCCSPHKEHEQHCLASKIITYQLKTLLRGIFMRDPCFVLTARRTLIFSIQSPKSSLVEKMAPTGNCSQVLSYFA